jgi:histidinol-phosphate aminotransferase
LLQPKSNINKIIPSSHGGINYGEIEDMGISPQSILDFSVNCNPFGPPPGIYEAMGSASIEIYPDSESMALTQTLSVKLGVSADNILAGSGSTELIRLISTAYFEYGDSVLIPQPTYGEYEIASQIVGAEVSKPASINGPDFQIDINKTKDFIKKYKPKGIFLCNPNNPTGQYISKENIERLISSVGESLLILDEAYIAFTENAWTSLDLLNFENVIVLRSMTKDYALAGLRLGYAIANRPIISTLKRIRPPWNITSISQNAGLFALKADAYLEDCGRKIQEAKEFLIKELVKAGLAPLPSQTNFFLVKVGNAAELRQALLKKGILVRDCTSFDLPEYIRIAPRTIPECQRLISALIDLRVKKYAS